MGNTRVLSIGVSVCLLLVVSSAFPPPARAAWVNSTGTQFQVGGLLIRDYSYRLLARRSPTPPASQGGTSLALVQGRSWPGSMRSCTPWCWS